MLSSDFQKFYVIISCHDCIFQTFKVNPKRWEHIITGANLFILESVYI